MERTIEIKVWLAGRPRSRPMEIRAIFREPVDVEACVAHLMAVALEQVDDVLGWEVRIHR